MHKKVSIIVPTYKRSQFIQRAIDSLLNQTYPNIEVIVIDDNHPNSEHRTETEKKMLKYANHSNVIYIKNEKNMGGALARNVGIYNASGDYITFLDDDDIYLPDKVNVQVNYMIKYDLDMSFTDVRIHNEADQLIDYREHPYIKNCTKQELLKLHIMHHLTPTNTYMFKRNVLIRIGGFDDVQMGQEFMLMLKAIESDLKIGYLPEAHVIQYLHEGERISIGENKINKEIELYQFKKKYFNLLSFRERQYVKFRHHSVMMIVGKRSKKTIIMVKHFILAVLTSPFDCVFEMINYIKKIGKYKNNIVESAGSTI